MEKCRQCRVVKDTSYWGGTCSQRCMIRKACGRKSTRIIVDPVDEKEFQELRLLTYVLSRHRPEGVRMRQRLYSNLHGAIRARIKGKKIEKWIVWEMLGCPVEDFYVHLESRFTEGMGWHNYGESGWHVDHVVPCSFFDIEREDHRRLCFNWQNLRPLWQAVNMSRSDGWVVADLEHLDPEFVEKVRAVGVKV